jgi:hypothetical protein
MKLVLILLLSLTSAFAKNSLVGAFAEYNFDAGNIKGTMKVELTNYNSISNTFTQTTTTTNSQGTRNIDTETVSADDINTQDENLMILSICETELGGSLQQMTVAAGTFDTCKITDTDSKFYFANVPFGYVKLISTIQTVELKSYSF